MDCQVAVVERQVEKLIDARPPKLIYPINLFFAIGIIELTDFLFFG